MNGLRSRLRTADLLGLGLHGLRARPMRAVLSALGIAIGIAAMIAVVGISTSSEALVKQKLAALGTNLLTATAGSDFFGQDSELPADAIDRVRRVDGVEQASWSATLKGVNVYRNALIDPGATGAVALLPVLVTVEDRVVPVGHHPLRIDAHASNSMAPTSRRRLRGDIPRV